MLSPVKAITAGALVFAIGGVLLIAQPFEQQGVVPGATISEPSEAVEFTATIPWGPEIAAGTSEVLASGVVEQVGWAHRTASASANDPRFDGEVVYTCNSHLYLDGQGRLFDCVFRVRMQKGLGRASQRCSWTSATHPSDHSASSLRCSMAKTATRA